MENLSQALLIAGGVLIGIILITMVIYAHGQISNYYDAKEESLQSEQLAQFNKQYLGYNRNNVRGSDLISLVNKIIDYNVDDMNYTNDEKIEISIIIPEKADGSHKNFFYKFDENYSGNTNAKLIEFGENKKFTHLNIKNKLLDPANVVENDYERGMATVLANKISTLMGGNSRQTTEQLLTELKIQYVDEDDIEEIQSGILEYYQYVQFKRAHFNCTDLTYKEGRVKSFTFEFNGKFE